ncbi:hypothetical protein DENSPDRAFT_839910 [Dentipellis sp. KUC8613]|nr:hypothetical protein DENSPDRAFT_839910 [Dentipellis sp. KUC8613]
MGPTQRFMRYPHQGRRTWQNIFQGCKDWQTCKAMRRRTAVFRSVSGPAALAITYLEFLPKCFTPWLRGTALTLTPDRRTSISNRLDKLCPQVLLRPKQVYCFVAACGPQSEPRGHDTQPAKLISSRLNPGHGRLLLGFSRTPPSGIGPFKATV